MQKRIETRMRHRLQKQFELRRVVVRKDEDSMFGGGRHAVQNEFRIASACLFFCLSVLLHRSPALRLFLSRHTDLPAPVRAFSAGARAFYEHAPVANTPSYEHAPYEKAARTPAIHPLAPRHHPPRCRRSTAEHGATPASRRCLA